jgi:hypothetical protein
MLSRGAFPLLSRLSSAARSLRARPVFQRHSPQQNPEGPPETVRDGIGLPGRWLRHDRHHRERASRRVSMAPTKEKRGATANAGLPSPVGRSPEPIRRGAWSPRQAPWRLEPAAGFAVTSSATPERIALTGHHRFADYELAFEVHPTPEGAEVCARTSAEFPGAAGRVYRALVIGSGGHRLAVGAMLRRIRRAAERPMPTEGSSAR